MDRNDGVIGYFQLEPTFDRTGILGLVTFINIYATRLMGQPDGWPQKVGNGKYIGRASYTDAAVGNKQYRLPTPNAFPQFMWYNIIIYITNQFIWIILKSRYYSTSQWCVREV